MAKENKPEDTNAVGTDQESGRPGGGQGRKDEVGRSGVYPFSGAETPEAAEVRPAGAWGQGERSAAGHEDHDRSRLTYEAGQRAEAHEEGGENLAAHSETGSVQIPPEEWISFFNGFSRQHEGWLVSITVTHGNEQNTQIRDCRLEGISSDHVTTGHEINLALDRTDGRHLTHPVNPKKVVFRQDLQGAHEGIDITSADGKLTAVRFRIAARPETLDGVLGDMQQENQRPSNDESTKSEQPGVGADAQIHEMAFHIPIDRVMLEGNLAIPPGARGTILFAHGSGSSRHSPRNRYVARVLQNAGFGTLLMDLLTTEEEALDDQTAALRFDINLLARRLIGATWWLQDQSATANLPIGYFGASTGAAAALVAAAAAADLVSAVVSRGGRPDLAGDALHKVIAPTLLIVGGNDMQVSELNRRVFDLIPGQKKLEIVLGATHLFEEPGALESVANLAANWFHIYLTGAGERTEAA